MGLNEVRDLFLRLAQRKHQEMQHPQSLFLDDERGR